MDRLKLKIGLLTNGISLKGKHNFNSRTFLSSISEGVHLILPEDIFVTASINRNSPFALISDRKKKL